MKFGILIGSILAISSMASAQKPPLCAQTADEALKKYNAYVDANERNVQAYDTKLTISIKWTHPKEIDGTKNPAYVEMESRTYLRHYDNSTGVRLEEINKHNMPSEVLKGSIDKITNNDKRVQSPGKPARPQSEQCQLCLSSR